MFKKQMLLTKRPPKYLWFFDWRQEMIDVEGMACENPNYMKQLL